MATRLWIFIQLAALCSGARPSEETLAESALARGTRFGKGTSVTAEGRMVLHKASSPETGSSSSSNKKVEDEENSPSFDLFGDDEDPNAGHNAIVPYVDHNASSAEKEASEHNVSAMAHFWKGFHGTDGDHSAAPSQKTAADHWHEAGGSLVPSLRLSGPLDIGMTDNLDAPNEKGLEIYSVRNTDGWSDKEGVSYRKTPDLGDASKDTDAGLVLWDKTVKGRTTDDGKFIEVDIQDEAGMEPKLRYLPKVVPGDQDADPPEPDHEILFEESPAFGLSVTGLENHTAAVRDVFHAGLEKTAAMRDALHTGLENKTAELKEALAMYRAHKKNAQDTIRAAKELAAHFSKGEPRLDDFIGETHAAETNAKYPSPATYFKGFDDFYNVQYGLKDATKPLLEHAQDLSKRAVGTYDSMKQLSGAIEKTVPVLNSVEAKADQARLKVDEESHDVVDRSLNAFGALRKYEANRGSIDDYYDAGKLSEKALLLEGQRHAESGKWDFFANEGFPSRYPQVKLDKLDTPQEHHLFSKVGNDVEAQPAEQVALPTPENINEDRAIRAHRPLSHTLDGRESSLGAGEDPRWRLSGMRPAEASKVEAEGLPGETRPTSQKDNDGVEDELVP